MLAIISSKTGKKKIQMISRLLFVSHPERRSRASLAYVYPLNVPDKVKNLSGGKQLTPFLQVTGHLTLTRPKDVSSAVQRPCHLAATWVNCRLELDVVPHVVLVYIDVFKTYLNCRNKKGCIKKLE